MTPASAVVRGSHSQFATFWIGNLLVGLPVMSVQEVISEQKLTPIPHAPAPIRGMMNLRGHIVTAIDLPLLVDPARQTASTAGREVIAHWQDELISLLVDRIDAVVEVDLAEKGRPMDGIHGPLVGLLTNVYEQNTHLLLALALDAVVGRAWEKSRS